MNGCGRTRRPPAAVAGAGIGLVDFNKAGQQLEEHSALLRRERRQDAFLRGTGSGAQAVALRGGTAHVYNGFLETGAVDTGLAGTAARAAAEAVNRTAGAVSAARSFLDDLRGHR